MTHAALRAGHSAAHLTRRFRLRLGLFVASSAVRAIMWVGFAIALGPGSR